jgi:proteasome activator subunit 4
LTTASTEGAVVIKTATAAAVPLQVFVVSRLQDPKVEVRSLATATLSGIIKALPPPEIDTLRTSFVNAVPRLFSTGPTGKKAAGGRKRPAGDTAAGGRGVAVVAAAAAAAAAPAAGGEVAQQQQQGAGFLAEAQAVVQGLKAFVLSAPYDVPGWMPQVLMALVTAANSRNPLVRLPCFLGGIGGNRGKEGVSSVKGGGPEVD